MSPSDEAPLLRPMKPADVPVLAAIFQASVEELAGEDYDDGQRQAWAAVADDEAEFGARLSRWLTLVATIRGAPVGFSAVENDSTIRMLYVYPRAARRGVGSVLLDAVERIAAGRKAALLEVDASDNARAFFEARGFTPQMRQTVSLGDQWLGNTRMTKALTRD